MSLLATILTASAVLLTIVILFVLLRRARACQPVSESQGLSLRESQALDEHPFSVLSIELAFDPDQAIIWETQVPAFRMLASAGKAGLRTEALYPLYVRSRRQYPELYDGASFESWLEFLQETKLIGIGIGTVSLTPEGWEFLKYGVTAAAFVVAPEATKTGHRSGS